MGEHGGWQAPVEVVAADDGDVVVATGDLQRQPYGPITFAVLDAKTGAERSRFAADDPELFYFSDVALRDGRLVYAQRSSIVSQHLSDGEEGWRTGLGPVSMTRSIDNKTVFPRRSGATGHVTALDTSTGQERWTEVGYLATGGNTTAVIGPSDGGRTLRGVDTGSGALRWRLDVPAELAPGGALTATLRNAAGRARHQLRLRHGLRPRPLKHETVPTTRSVPPDGYRSTRLAGVEAKRPTSERVTCIRHGRTTQCRRDRRLRAGGQRWAHGGGAHALRDVRWCSSLSWWRACRCVVTAGPAVAADSTTSTVTPPTGAAKPVPAPGWARRRRWTIRAATSARASASTATGTPAPSAPGRRACRRCEGREERWRHRAGCHRRLGQGRGRHPERRTECRADEGRAADLPGGQRPEHVAERGPRLPVRVPQLLRAVGPCDRRRVLHLDR